MIRPVRPVRPVRNDFACILTLEFHHTVPHDPSEKIDPGMDESRPFIHASERLDVISKCNPSPSCRRGALDLQLVQASR